MLASIAWRNLWRNPRRTALTLLAMSGCLAGLLAFDAIFVAMTDRLLEGMTGSYMGHVQLHRQGYREERQLGLSVPDADEVVAALREAPGVEGAAARVYGFAHASLVRGDDSEVRAGGGEDVAAPVTVLLGVDPSAEQEVTDLHERISEGRWLEGGAEVVIGHGLAERHGARVGDAFLPTAIGASGAVRGPWAVSEEVPRVVGILRSGIEDLDRRMALMPRDYVARLAGIEGQAHEVVVRGASPQDLGPLTEAVSRAVAQARAEATRAAATRASVPLRIGPETADGRAPSAGDGPSARLLGVPLPEEGSEGEEVATVGGGDEAVPLGEGHFPRLAEEMALGEPLARRLGLSIGDRVAVAVPVECGEGVAESECPPSAEPFVVSGVLRGELPWGGEVALVGDRVLSSNIAALAPESVVPLEGAEQQGAARLVTAAVGGASAADEILPWDELAPEIRDILTFMEALPVLFGVIIYFAVALGIINTLLMATFERTRELGLMRALGMRPVKVVAMVIAESAMLAGVGAVIGVVLGGALVSYWGATGLDLSSMTGGHSMEMAGVHVDSVLWPRLTPNGVVTSTVVVGVMTILAGLWPAIRAARAQAVTALREE